MEPIKCDTLEVSYSCPLLYLYIKLLGNMTFILPLYAIIQIAFDTY